MRKMEIKETREVLIATHYVAMDGTEFLSEEECSKYEDSALCAVSVRLKKYNKRDVSVMDLYDEGCDEDMIEVFNVENQVDLDNLRQYVYLVMAKNGHHFKEKETVLDKVTFGHEVILRWCYDWDDVYVVGDGSLQAILDSIKENFKNFALTKEEIRAMWEARRNADANN